MEIFIFKIIFIKKTTKLNRSLVLDWFGGKEGFFKSHEENFEIYLPNDYRLD
jgi:hypothetical protein